MRIQVDGGGKSSDYKWMGVEKVINCNMRIQVDGGGKSSD